MSNVDASSFYEDKLIVRGLNVRAVVGGDHWARPKLQPILMNIVFYTNIEVCGETDLLTHSLSYSDLAAKATQVAEEETHASVFELATKICSHLLQVFQGFKVTVSVQKPKGLLHADSSGIEITRTREIVSRSTSKEIDSDIPIPNMDFCKDDKVFIDGLRLNSIIGIHPWEREAKQVVLLYLTLYPGESNTGKATQSSPLETQLLVTKLSDLVETSRFKTVEALATSVSRLVLFSCNYPKVTVRVEKPSALRFAAGAAAEITRDISYFSQDKDQPPKKILKASTNGQSSSESVVYIGLGSNLQNRYENIAKALTFLKEQNCKILDTSFLYETAPMYISDQPKFLNAVCKISTTLEPIALLDLLKKIEEDIGRVPTFRNGPRLVDVDILDYEGLAFVSERLELPHPRICEREFVLRPLCDIDPTWVHPILRCTAQHLLQSLEKTHGTDVVKALPLPGGIIMPLGVQTYVMGILNVTPDSFSDGGKYNDLTCAVQRAKDLLSGGADIIDIGGASSRPGAEDVPVEEELSRILPIIRQLRSEGIACPISVDTFHAQVAEEAILAGASLINDISGGTRDPNMLSLISRLDVPICLMHMRGNSSTMNDLAQYTKGQVMQTVHLELETCFRSASNAGIYRWNLIADPGIGFSKDCQQNIEILRNLKMLTRPYPCLLGTSRKKFLGALTGKVHPEQRTWATAATCTAAIAAGVDFLRVHDVSELKDVIKVSDAIYRNPNTL